MDQPSSPRSGGAAALPPDDGSSSPHVRPPRQERSRETLERLVEAARGLIAEEGVEAATVSRVVERADSSVGSFYARFEGKDDLLRYLAERVWAVARQRWDEALATRPWDELDLDGVVRTVVQLLVRLHEEDADARQVLERQASGARGLSEEARRFHARLEADVRELLLRHRKTIGHPRPERAASVAYRWALGGIRELLGATEDGTGFPEEGGLDADAVVDEVSRGVVAYLGGGTGDGRGAPDEDVEFFDVWA